MRLTIRQHVTDRTTTTAAVLFMAALRNRAGHYIFALWFLLLLFLLLLLLLSFYLFPRLISALADWISTILLHMVWPMCEFRTQV